MKNNIAIILARGGSKGIKNKNIKLFLGKPLVEWSIIQAKKSKKINNIYLSSDSEKILNVGRKHKINIIKRPKNISGDTAKSEEAVLHALNQIHYEPDSIVMLEPTAPLREPNDIDNCIDLFFNNELDSGFVSASIITIIFGVLFFLTNLDHNKNIDLPQAFILTALSWISIAIFGSLPFIFSDLSLNFTDAFFESMSGITTTGSTIITNLKEKIY